MLDAQADDTDLGDMPRPTYDDSDLDWRACQSLMVAWVHRTVTDACSGTPAVDEQVRARARRFMRSPDFLHICELIGLDRDYVRDRVRRLLDGEVKMTFERRYSGRSEAGIAAVQVANATRAETMRRKKAEAAAMATAA